MTINFFNDPLPCLGWSDCKTTIAFCSKTSRRFWPVWTAWRLVLVYDQWLLHMIDLQTFEACTCHCHFWSVSRLALCLPFSHIICCGSLRMNSIIKAGQRAGSSCKVEMEFCLHRCIVTPSLFSERLWQATPRSFLKKKRPLFLWPQPTHQQGTLLSPRKTGGYDCKSVHIRWEGFCLHVFSIWNAAFANTQIWEGRSRHFWLRLQCCSKHHHPRLLSCFGSFHSKGHVLL